jgi:hypothetical protein
MGFFQLNTPKDMLEKAKRELTQLETADSMAADSIDHIYNFFVTAYHIVDYLDGRSAMPDVEAIKAEPLILSCCDACNKAKHMRLTRKRPDVVTPTHYNFLVGGPPNTPDKSLERWIVWQDGTNLEAISFARSVIRRFERVPQACGHSYPQRLALGRVRRHEGMAPPAQIRPAGRVYHD